MTHTDQQQQETEGLSWTSLRESALKSIATMEVPDDIEVPALPHAVTEFVDKANNPDADVKELAGIVETCPGLTIELLRYVNSSAFSPSQPIRNVRQAIAHIGIRGATTYLIAAGIKAATSAVKSRLLNHRNFWNESFQRALFARATASHLKLDPDLAFIAGLLQDFLLPALTNRFDQEYVRFLEEDAKEGRDLIDWEQERFGWNHATAAAVAAKQWRLPDDLLCAFYYHHSLKTTLSRPEAEFFHLFPVSLASLLPDQLKQCPAGIRELIKVDSKCPAIDLNSLCSEVDKEQLQQAQGFDIPDHLSNIVQKERTVLLATATT